MLLFNLVLTGLVGAVAIGAIAIVISGILTKEKISERISNDAIVKSINNCTNTITLEELENDTVYEIRGDDIADDIEEGDWIYV